MPPACARAGTMAVVIASAATARSRRVCVFLRIESIQMRQTILCSGFRRCQLPELRRSAVDRLCSCMLRSLTVFSADSEVVSDGELSCCFRKRCRAVCLSRQEVDHRTSQVMKFQQCQSYGILRDRVCFPSPDSSSRICNQQMAAVLGFTCQFRRRAKAGARCLLCSLLQSRLTIWYGGPQSFC